MPPPVGRSSGGYPAIRSMSHHRGYCSRESTVRPPHRCGSSCAAPLLGRRPPPGLCAGTPVISGPGHRTRNTTRGVYTTVYRSQVAQDTAHTAQHTERTHQRRAAKWPSTPHPQHNTFIVHTGEQEASGQGHRTRNRTSQACTLVNRSQVAQDTAHTSQHAGPAHR